MELNLERPDYEFALRAANGVSALVNNLRLTHSFVIAPDHLMDTWAVTDAASLGPAELAPLLELQPEVILLGTGEQQVFPSAATRAACLARGVGMEVMTNAAAARTFNVLASEGRKVVAGFILAG
ncbi:Mth938-like domain-containing protein [Lysobacter sp. A289]